MEYDNVRIKLECKEIDPCENSRAVHNLRNHNRQWKSPITANRKSTMDFPTSHQPRSCVTLTSPKWRSDTQIWRFSHKCRQKPLKVWYKVSLSKSFQQQSCSAINYQSTGINILVGDDPVPKNFGPKLTDPQQEGCAFHVSHADRCAVVVNRPCWYRLC